MPLLEDDFEGKALDTTVWGTALPWSRAYLSNETYALDYNSPEPAVPFNSWLNLLQQKQAKPFDARIITGDLRICSEASLFAQLDTIAQANCKAGRFPISSHNPSQLDKLVVSDGRPNLRPFVYLSQNLVSRRLFKYGKFEMRFKFLREKSYSEASRGHWQSFWLFGGSEIDVFEIDNVRKWWQKKRNYQINLHHFSGDKDYSANFVHQRNLNLDEFIQADSSVTVGVVWYPKGVLDSVEVVLWYLNNQVVRALRFQDLRSRNEKSTPAETSMMYLIVSPGIAHQLDRNGMVRPIWNGPPQSSSILNYGMSVDYVKVWQFANLYKEISGRPSESIWYLPRVNYSTTAHPELQQGLVSGRSITQGSHQWSVPWEDQFHLLKAYENAEMQGQKVELPAFHRTFLDFTAAESIKIAGNAFKAPLGTIFKAKVQPHIDPKVAPQAVLIPTGNNFYYEVTFHPDSSSWLTLPFENTKDAEVLIYEGNKHRPDKKPFYRYHSIIHQGQLPIWNGNTPKKRKWYWIEVRAKNDNFTKTYRYCFRAFWDTRPSISIYSKIGIPSLKDLY